MERHTLWRRRFWRRGGDHWHLYHIGAMATHLNLSPLKPKRLTEKYNDKKGSYYKKRAFGDMDP